MKKVLFTMLLLLSGGLMYGQTIYYWVGGTNPTTSINTGANWNTAINGSGSSRPSSTGVSDILIFDGTNVGGATAATGPVAVLGNAGITCAQLKFVNNATVSFVRASTGTSTFILAGEVGDDFFIEAGSSASFISTVGSMRITMNAGTTGRVSGTFTVNSSTQFRIENGVAGLPGSFVFTSGAVMNTNLTGSGSYAFGGNTQSSEKWVLFEDGAQLYYNGGNSPMGNNSAFSAIDFRPNSTWRHRGDNTIGAAGSFFNRKSFGNIIVENGGVLTADGPMYRIQHLTVNSGCTMTTHTSGQTVILGDLTVAGTLNGTVDGTNELMMAGVAAQNISGAGNINVAGLNVGASATVNLNKSIGLSATGVVNGHLNFNTHQLTGAALFTANGAAAALTASVNTTAGSYLLRGNTTIPTTARGFAINGAGLANNSTIVSFSLTGDSIYISAPATATGTGITVTASTSGATLATANTNGFESTLGSVVTTGNKTFDNGINYILNAATTKPFGISTGSTASSIRIGSVAVNAAVTANTSISVAQQVSLNGKFSLRAADTLHLLSGATLTGTFNNSNYIATNYNTGAGVQSFIQYDGLTAATTIPMGTAGFYMPLTVTPTGSTNLLLSAYDGITANGLISGTPFTTLQQQTVVNAVWTINRLVGTGNVSLNFGWDNGQEGTAFASLPGTDIGVIQNTGVLWSAPLGTGDNLNNTASATVSALGSFGIGAVAQVDPFVFNELLPKIYGEADFNGGATSLNTAQPIVYSSSNPLVATIVSGDIRIRGAGTVNITASQASDGFYPAASVTRSLIINKAPLTITADNKNKFEGLVNPILTATYSGLVLGETAAALLTPAVLATTAVTSSAPGTYPITVNGATSNNYDINFVNGVMTVIPKQNQTITFNVLAARNYGAANFAAAGTSTNTTIPIVYTSSNTAVATIAGNIIQIVGAGTTNITASQAGSDGYFPAANVVRSLTINKVPLTVRVRDTTKIEGTENPPFTVTYTGFVLGETTANLSTVPSISTMATASSIPGYYAITPANGVSANYNFNYVAGRLTIFPASDTTQQYLYAFINNNRNLTVRVYAAKPTIGDVLVYDLSGRLIARKNIFIPRGFISSEILLGTIPQGLYVVAVKGPGVNLSKMISLNR